MGQYAYIYRISKENFETLKNSTNRQDLRLSNLAIEYWEFQGSFMAIEFILSKNQSEEKKRILFEIFYPSDALGSEELENMEENDRYSFYESGKYIPYLDCLRAGEINNILQNITTEDLRKMYSSKELNKNGIYPSGSWHDDNAENKVFNLRQITEDVTEIKKIFKAATENQNYLLSFIS
jgi:hypothetical protein